MNTSSVPTIVAQRYEPLETLRTTSLAIVYKARDSETGEIVALKLFHSYISDESEGAQNYLELMEKLKGIRHSNILSILGIERHEGNFVQVMDYLPWPTLRDRAEGPLSLDRVLQILKPIAEAIDYAHSLGVIHRDIKPSNIFLNPETSEVKLSDFGTATLIEDGHLLIRSTANTPLPCYTAPEQAQGMSPHSANDIYSLGALLYELLTDCLPYDALNPDTVLVRQLTTTAIPPSELEPSIPTELDSILFKCLSRNQDERYSSAHELVEAVEQVVVNNDIATSQVTTKEALSLTNQSNDVDGRIFCPHCGHGNAATTPRCFYCWGALQEEPVVSREEEKRLISRYLSAIRRRKRIVWGTFAGIYAILIGLFLNNLFDFRLPTPSPSTNMSSVSAIDEWRMFQNNATRTGSTQGTGFVPKGDVKWTFSSNGPIFSTPAVAEGRIYFGTSDRRVVALEANTGKTLWEHPVTGPINSSPAIAGNSVFIGLRDGNVLALDKTNGNLIWKFDAGSGIYSSPVVQDGVLYIGSGDSNIYAVDAGTGELRWSLGTGGWVVSSPAVSQNITAIGGLDGEIYLVNATNGSLRFQYNAGGSIPGPVTIVDDTVFVTTARGKIYAIDLTKRDIPLQKGIWKTWFTFWVWGIAPKPPKPPGALWYINSEDGIISHLITDGEHLFAANYLGTLQAHDINNNGKLLWGIETKALLRSAPIISGDTIILTSSDGLILGVDRRNGQELWAITIDGTKLGSPVLANGVLYIPSQDGTLYAVE